jgi:hypothetical protein
LTWRLRALCWSSSSITISRYRLFRAERRLAARRFSLFATSVVAGCSDDTGSSVVLVIVSSTCLEWLLLSRVPARDLWPMNLLVGLLRRSLNWILNRSFKLLRIPYCCGQ